MSFAKSFAWHDSCYHLNQASNVLGGLKDHHHQALPRSPCPFSRRPNIGVNVSLVVCPARVQPTFRRVAPFAAAIH